VIQVVLFYIISQKLVREEEVFTSVSCHHVVFNASEASFSSAQRDSEKTKSGRFSTRS